LLLLLVAEELGVGATVGLVEGFVVGLGLAEPPVLPPVLVPALPPPLRPLPPLDPPVLPPELVAPRVLPLVPPPELPAELPPELPLPELPPPLPVEPWPLSTLVRFAWAETSAAFAADSVSFAVVGSTRASSWPAVTFWPALTYTPVSVPPVVKLTPESVGEVSEPEPETVARTVPRWTVAVLVVLLELVLLPLFTVAYATPAPVTSTTASTEFNRTALRRRGSAFMPHRLSRASGEALGEVCEFAGSDTPYADHQFRT
jgi:hypothetical protein